MVTLVVWEMLCVQLVFDRDEDYLATVGVSEKIKVFDFHHLQDEDYLATNVIVKMANVLRTEARHNVVAHLDDSTLVSAPYREMIKFLQRSRIHYAITTNPPVYTNLVQEFWTSAVSDQDEEPPCMRVT